MVINHYPDSKVHGAWGLSASDGPHIGPMNLTIRICITYLERWQNLEIYRGSLNAYIRTYIASVVFFLAETNTTSARGSSTTWLNGRTDSHRVQYSGCESWRRQAYKKQCSTQIYSGFYSYNDFNLFLSTFSLSLCEILHLLCALVVWTLWRFYSWLQYFKRKSC